MIERVCLNCKSPEFFETGIVHVLIEQENVRFDNQVGVEVTPIICKNAGLSCYLKNKSLSNNLWTNMMQTVIIRFLDTV